MLHVIHKIREFVGESLEYKRRMFLMNMKARKIQLKFRNYLIKKRVINSMSPRLKLFFQAFIVKFLYKRRVRAKRLAAHLIIKNLLRERIKRKLRTIVYKLLLCLRK